MHIEIMVYTQSDRKFYRLAACWAGSYHNLVFFGGCDNKYVSLCKMYSSIQNLLLIGRN